MKRQLRLQRVAKRSAGASSGRRSCGWRATVGMKVAAAKKMPTAISLGRRWALRGGVDEDEVSEDQAAEDEVEVDGFGFEARKEEGEGDGGDEDAGEEGGAVAVVEEVAGFEGVGLGGLGVEETVGGVEHPDGDGHGEGGGEGEAEVVGAGDEPGPERGYGGGVEGEEMPEGEGGVSAGAGCGSGWCCGGHSSILGGVGEAVVLA